MSYFKIGIYFLTIIILTACSQTNEEKSFESDNGKIIEKQFPYEQQFINKNFPFKKPDIRAWKEARQIVAADTKSGLRTEGSWEVQGPGNIGARINTVTINPDNSDEILIGFSSGGVFKTTDNGQSWDPIFDSQPDLNIGYISYDPSNPNTIYVGTGDPNISGYPKIGSGLYKSTDGGNTWTYIGLESASIISKIHVAPTDPSVIYTATMGIPFVKSEARGVYKSIDGGQSWDQKLMINDSTGVIDMLVHPSDPDIVYAAGWNRNRNDSISRITGPDARIHKSIDGGDSWEILEGGLPIEDNLGRIGLAMSGIDSEHIYASYARGGGHDSCASGGSQLYGIYESLDAGLNWSEINTHPDTGMPCNALGGFAWYFGQIRVNPKDDNDIFILGVDLWRTRNKGDSWERAVPSWSTYQVHADKHDLIFNEDRIVLATDGGLYQSVDDANDWTDIENIPATQFYRVAYNPHKPNLYYGGAQDNGTSGGNNDMINEWPRIYGGDGFQMAFDPSDSLIYFVETQNGRINVTYNGGDFFDSANLGFDSGESTNWDTPYFISAHDPKTLFAGRQSAYIGTSVGGFTEWFKISDILTDTTDNDNFFSHNISTIHQSPINEDNLYVGTSDGLVWSTTDGGENWDNISEGVPYRYISDIKASPLSESTVFISVSGYKSNDFTPYIYRSDDHGQTWEAINGNLPQIAINDILVLPDYDDRVICVATDGGVYITIDGGLIWDRLGDNMPIIEVYDLVYNPVMDEIVAGTFARGIQTFDLSQTNLLEPNNITELDVQAIDIYPTVTINDISINNIDNRYNYYQIFNLAGQTVQKGNLGIDQTVISTSNLDNGMYIITATGKNKVGNAQFIKQ